MANPKTPASARASRTRASKKSTKKKKIAAAVEKKEDMPPRKKSTKKKKRILKKKKDVGGEDGGASEEDAGAIPDAVNSPFRPKLFNQSSSDEEEAEKPTRQRREIKGMASDSE